MRTQRRERGGARSALLLTLVVGCHGGARAPSHDGPARVALLSPPSASASHAAVAGLRSGLADAGLLEGRDFVWRETADPAGLDAPPDLWLATSAPALSAILRADPHAPVVVTDVADPLAAGAQAPTLLRRWLPWLARDTSPAVSGVLPAIDLHRLLVAATPLLDARELAVVYAADDAEAAAWYERLREAADAVGRRLHGETIATPAAASETIRRLCAQGISGVVVLGDPASDALAAALLSAAQACPVPVLGTRRAHARAGALLTQTVAVRAAAHDAGSRAAQALRGDDIGGLGFAQRDGGALIVNTAAAQRAGLGVPLTVIESADEVMGD